jgi:succinoglycan biosynthesis protein ExoA
VPAVPKSDRVAASILVPVLNERRHIDETARAMLAQHLDEPYEVLFIDGGSSDCTRERLAELAAKDTRVRVLDNPSRYTPHALNLGLRAARAPVVVRMDAHTIYPADYLRRGLERLRRGDVAWVSGPQLPRGVDVGSRRVALALSMRLGTGGASFRHAVGAEIEGDTGFTGVFDRAWLERVGGWDERWIINQDSELGARMREAGARIVILPEMAAHYLPRSRLRALARQYARYGYYRCLTCRRHPGSMRPGHIAPPGLALMALTAVGPRGPQRRLARLGTAAYAALLASSAARARRDATPRDAAAVPLVLGTMHLSWGAGFLAASTRHGPPLRALATLAARFRPRRQAGRRAAPAAPTGSTSRATSAQG